MDWELRHGRWEEALADIEFVDAVICDPPYSTRTHDRHDAGATLANRAGSWPRSDGGMDLLRPRREISYAAWTQADVDAFVAAWAPRCRGWFVAFSDSDLCREWRAAFEAHGLTGFQPLPVYMPGMTVRMSGDGPSSWAVYLNVARQAALHRWGTLPGGYTGTPGQRGSDTHIGGKPEWLMRAIVRDYTRTGNLVCDPVAGYGTTLLAACIEGRRAIGAEVDDETHEAGVARLAAGYIPDLFSLITAKQCEKCRGRFRYEAFAADRSHESGRQSWCRACKARWELGPDNTWKRLEAWLAESEPTSLGGQNGWTEELYLARWAEVDGKCELCGAGLREWQGRGHNLDRINNNAPHIPGNCRLLCWPCNRAKSNGSPLAKDVEIGGWVKQFGKGRVPWDVIRQEWSLSRAEPVSVEEYRVVPEQMAFNGITNNGGRQNG